MLSRIYFSSSACSQLHGAIVVDCLVHMLVDFAHGIEEVTLENFLQGGQLLWRYFAVLKKKHSNLSKSFYIQMQDGVTYFVAAFRVVQWLDSGLEESTKIIFCCY